MTNEHIVSSFDQELGQVESLILEMGGLVDTQIMESATALDQRDVELAEKVRRDDKQVDALEHQIDDLALRVIALRQPVANDLRRVISALKVAASLERIGDYAKNIAKRTGVLAQSQPVGSSLNAVSRMTVLVREMLKDVLDAYVSKSAEAALDVRERDEEVDLLHNALFRELLTYMMEDARNITPCMHLLFIAKNVERMGDHITGIAEQVYFLATGALPDESRTKKDITSTLSAEDDDKDE